MASKEQIVNVRDRLPPVNRWVIVVTPTFRCMAYLDEKGTWRDVNRPEDIADVESWVEPEDAEPPFKSE